MTARSTSLAMVLYPWDSVPHFSPEWKDIEGKARNYQTARKRATGEIVKLCGITKYCDGLELSEPCFIVRDSIGVAHYSTVELCGFVL